MQDGEELGVPNEPSGVKYKVLGQEEEESVCPSHECVDDADLGHTEPIDAEDGGEDLRNKYDAQDDGMRERALEDDSGWRSAKQHNEAVGEAEPEERASIGFTGGELAEFDVVDEHAEEEGGNDLEERDDESCEGNTSDEEVAGHSSRQAASLEVRNGEEHGQVESYEDGERSGGDRLESVCHPSGDQGDDIAQRLYGAHNGKSLEDGEALARLANGTNQAA